MERAPGGLDKAVASGGNQRRFRMVPVRYLLPNMITLLALCSGVTAIRFALEDRYELAVASVMLAVILDAVDGRLARLLKGTSRFGAELDSLADFVNFGVAPAVLLYVWSLNALHTLGWVICLVLAICCALRLARFNVTLDDPDKPAWANRFFAGAPAPAGAGLALLPFYLGFLGIIDEGHGWALAVGPYVVVIAMLMISRVPTFSGKHMGRIRGDMVLPVLGLTVLAVVMLMSYPWEFLTIVSIAYLALIPVSVRSYRKLRAADTRGTGTIAP
ncbi:phosphatidylcholine/phosphatidylserine synthase [Aestuariivirga sp.]|uniref:CDP-alcohol phosphatidyltransferase family protein n=1 Tax=Aestuariivirga sp. TaxID=2650926 RepID=UPI0025C390A6|nr:phosphatidylcholine/phosphatidylserine synthase [Aestuariivirga sp.]MCA3555448.1 phosphatidylcholine/phosphatidylserine synthase [Aestuariivirga sp.]